MSGTWYMDKSRVGCRNIVVTRPMVNQGIHPYYFTYTTTPLFCGAGSRCWERTRWRVSGKFRHKHVLVAVAAFSSGFFFGFPDHPRSLLCACLRHLLQHLEFCSPARLDMWGGGCYRGWKNMVVWFAVCHGDRMPCADVLPGQLKS